MSASNTHQTGSPRWLWAVVIIAGVFAVYANSISAPFLFDDGPAIAHNPTIRSLWPLWGPMNPPATGAGVTGRPVVNLTLAVNYAVGGLDVNGYRATNIALHALTALILLGLLRRTLRCVPSLADRAEMGAGLAALLWAVHPLLTESVVCVVQRNEVLGGLFYLLTLYAFTRTTDGGARAVTWQIIAVAACLLGVASKEIVATAPLMVLLYDRTFVAGSFAAAWRPRKGFYLALASTWLVLAWLMAGNHQRGSTVGFGLGMNSWEYLLTQCRALMVYLQLALWPHPLIVDYGSEVGRFGDVWWRGLVIVASLIVTVWALWRRPIWGFAGAWFFVILAPSSSIVPLTTQTIAEHRMYLPLIAIIAVMLAALHRIAGRRTVVAGSLIAATLAVVTVQRNADYGSALALWSQTVAGAPTNARAHLNFGEALFQQENYAAAAAAFETALRLKPTYAEAHYNLGLTQVQLGQREPGIGHFEAAVRLEPDYAVAHNDLGIALAQSGRIDAAQAHFETALQLRPDFAGAQYNLGNLLLRTERPAKAVPHYETALKLNPGSAEYHSNLAVALMQTGRRTEAVAHYETAVNLTPSSPDLQLSLALALAANGRLSDAIPHAREALRLRPDFSAARDYLSAMESDLNRMTEPKP